MPNRQTRRALAGKGRARGSQQFIRTGSGSLGHGREPVRVPPSAALTSGDGRRQGPPAPEPATAAVAAPRGSLAEIRRRRVARDRADEQLRRAVDQARSEGESWTTIGAALSVSRQSAWERYGRGVKGAGGGAAHP